MDSWNIAVDQQVLTQLSGGVEITLKKKKKISKGGVRTFENYGIILPTQSVLHSSTL